MNKTDIVEILYDHNRKDFASKAAAERAVDTIFDTISKTVVAGEKVKIDKFGVFELVKHAARKGTNPQTQEIIKIKAKKTVKFSPAKLLKEKSGKSRVKV